MQQLRGTLCPHVWSLYLSIVLAVTSDLSTLRSSELSLINLSILPILYMLIFEKLMGISQKWRIGTENRPMYETRNCVGTGQRRGQDYLSEQANFEMPETLFDGDDT
ncbi:hypothetical protein KC19_1G291900 [Ceratodon purpureus]|uniref:Uncharacterized protein n=1 Tax=Ceratodon purpureus TaxID=3225 RepID=A0A8T0JB04_CERPU|nr:hypothetical protein KC19_1G291900 [Ceratodon purpureus]